MVGAGYGGEPGMQVLPDLPGAEDGNIGGKETVQFEHPLLQALVVLHHMDGFRSVEMGNEGGCVDPRIGAACTRQIHGKSKHGANGFFHDLLDSPTVRLDLPAAVIRAVIGHMKEIPGHRSPKLPFS